MDAIAAELGLDRAEVRRRNFIQPDEMPYDQGLIFQDGRPLDVRLRRLPGVAGPSSRSWSAGTSSRPSGSEARGRGAAGRHRRRLLRRGHRASARTRAATSTSRPSGKVKVATGLTTQGQGHQTVFAQIVADELGVPFEDVEVVTGDTRRMPYAVGTFASRAAVMSGSAIALAARAAREKVAADRGRGAGGRSGRPGDRRRAWCTVKGSPGTAHPDWAPSRCCPTRCATPSTRRRRPPPSSRSAIRTGRRSPRTTSPGSRAATSTRRRASTFACGMHAVDRRDRSGDRRDHASCATAWCTTAAG